MGFIVILIYLKNLEFSFLFIKFYETLSFLNPLLDHKAMQFLFPKRYRFQSHLKYFKRTLTEKTNMHEKTLIKTFHFMLFPIHFQTIQSFIFFKLN